MKQYKVEVGDLVQIPGSKHPTHEGPEMFYGIVTKVSKDDVTATWLFGHRVQQCWVESIESFGYRVSKQYYNIL